MGITGLLIVAAVLGLAAAGSQAELPRLIITELHPPVYSPLAAAARIHGDVVLIVRIGPDGTADSVVAFSRHPLLSAGALESARRSRFECVGCSAAGGEYPATYSFSLPTLDIGCGATASPELLVLRVSFSGDHVTVARPQAPFCLGPPSPPIKVRSARCLYLWKCRSVIYAYE